MSKKRRRHRAAPGEPPGQPQGLKAIVYRQVRANRGPAVSGLARAAFPILAKPGDWPPGKALEGLSGEAIAIVEQLQPYKQPPDPVGTSLGLLNLLARIDRHRMIHMAAAQPTEIESRGLSRDRAGRPGLNLTMTTKLFLVDIEQHERLDSHGVAEDLISAVDQAILRLAAVGPITRSLADILRDGPADDPLAGMEM